MEYADEKSISDNLAMLGLAYMRQSKYDEALHYMRRCYQLDSKSGDPDRISSSLNTIAGTLLAAGNPEEAEGYSLRAITYAKKANNPSRMAVIYGMASEIENRLEHKEQALLYADSACLIESSTGNRYKMAVRLTQKASILLALNRLPSAQGLALLACYGGAVSPLQRRVRPRRVGEREGTVNPQQPPPRRYRSSGRRRRNPLYSRFAHLVPTPPEQD